MSINLSKRSKFTESLKKRASGSTLSSMGADPLNPSYVQSQLEEARASLRSQGDTLNDLEYERDALKQEAGKAFVERDEAHESVQKLQEMLDTMRQELAEARRSSVAQDRLTASPQHRLIEMEAAIEAERRARHLTEDAAKRSIAQLEDERDALKRGLQAAQGECAEAKAASQAARDAKDSFREELFTTQLALRHRVDELNMLEDRRIAVELGLEVLRKAAEAEDKLDRIQQNRIYELESALEAERRARQAAELKATGGGDFDQHGARSRRDPEAEVGTRGEYGGLTHQYLRDDTRGARYPPSVPGHGSRASSEDAESETSSERGCTELMPGALDVQPEALARASIPSQNPRARMSEGAQTLWKAASDGARQYLSSRDKPNILHLASGASETRPLRGLMSQGQLEVSLMACLGAVLLLSLLQLMSSLPYPPRHEYDHGVLQVASRE